MNVSTNRYTGKCILFKPRITSAGKLVDDVVSKDDIIAFDSIEKAKINKV